MALLLDGLQSTAYLGVKPTQPPQMLVFRTSPTITDAANIGSFWLNFTTQQLYVLTSVANHVFTWQLIGAGGGMGASHFIEDIGTADQVAGTLNVIGGNGIQTSGAGNTVTVSTDGTIANSFDTNPATGVAVPVAGVLTFAGAGSIVVTAGGSTITIDDSGGSNAQEFQTDSGANAVPLAGVLEISGTGLALSNMHTESPGTGNQVFVALNDTVLINENLGMNNTAADGLTGVITWGGTQFIHQRGSMNTFVGQSAGNLLLTVGSAIDNTGVGANVLQFLTTGNGNSGFGTSALSLNTTGNGNSAFGLNALADNTIGTRNTAVGYSALTALTGNQSTNTAVGALALEALTGGDNNEAFGDSALNNLVSGDFNIAIGTSSGAAYTGAESNNILIGNAGVLGESNILRIGESGIGPAEQNTAYVAGIYANAGVLAAGFRVVMSDSNDLLAGLAPTLDGQILIGSGTGAVAYNRLTAGAGVTIANNPGSITISATGMGTGTVTFTTDAGTATEAAGNINVVGTANEIATSAPGAADTVQIGLATDVIIAGSLEITTTLTVDSFTEGVLFSDNAGAITSDPGDDGQVIIGATAGAPIWADVTSGDGSITITPGANTLDLTVTNAAGLVWAIRTTNLNPMLVNHGYITNGGAQVVLTLPTVSSVGDIIEVVAMNANGWQIAQNAGQSIQFTTSSTTVGAGGSLASTHIGDGVRMVCNVANLNWIVLSSIGNAITVV